MINEEQLDALIEQAKIEFIENDGSLYEQAQLTTLLEVKGLNAREIIIIVNGLIKREPVKPSGLVIVGYRDGKNMVMGGGMAPGEVSVVSSGSGGSGRAK